jgi:zinc finger HIT domain-containing protein 3
MICNVCTLNDSKYKCPTCNVKYCSVDCFKNHKLSKCEDTKEKQNEEVQIIEDKIGVPSHTNLFETIDTVNETKLKELESSEELKNILRNPHLRSFLTQLNEAKSSWKAMKAAMQEPLFLEFSDICLGIVEGKKEKS